MFARNSYIIITISLLSLQVVSMDTPIFAADNTVALVLPWETIAQKYSEDLPFCSKAIADKDKEPQAEDNETLDSEPRQDFILDPKESVKFILPQEIAGEVSLPKIEVHSRRWQQEGWQDIRMINTPIDPNGIVTIPSPDQEGLYEFTFNTTNKTGDPKRSAIYAIICNNWKKDMLAFCRNLKDKIESNPDPRLIYSSIVISHIDHTMDIASNATFVSCKVLEALTAAVGSGKDFEGGQIPDLVVGLNKIRLRRFSGGPIAEFALLIPFDYDDSKKWPLFVHVDPRRWSVGKYANSEGMIDLWWHTISHKDMQWKEYQTILSVIKEKLNIDEERVYLDGACGNGLAAMALALNHPDRWAECSISLGNSYRHLAGNALNLPTVFVKGGGYGEYHQLVNYYDFAVKCFEYYGCRHFISSKTMGIIHARGTVLPEAVREHSPQRVLLLCETLQHNKAYWLQIDGRCDENILASIDATIAGQTIYVEINNVDAYSINLKHALLDVTRPIDIVEIPDLTYENFTAKNTLSDQNPFFFVKNDHVRRYHCNLSAVDSTGKAWGYINDDDIQPVINDDLTFFRKPSRYHDAKYIKTSRLSGPIGDTFTDAYAVIYGTTGEDIDFIDRSKHFAEQIAGGAPCVEDVNSSEDLINSHNLILIGTPESNRLMAQIAGELPIQIKDGIILADGKSFNYKDMGFILVYPNPMNPVRYVVVFYANSVRAVSQIAKALSQVKKICPADVGIYEVTDNNGIKWHVLEKFDTLWGWHSQYGDILATVEREHPKWKWRQWLARAIRKQLDTDVVICEDHFKFAEAAFPTRITHRGLFNTFKNDWIVKIRLDGRSLRELLMVPFNNISRRSVAAPVIDGVSMIKLGGNAAEKTISINELVADQIYTAAFPYRCINGQRLGLVLRDYEIVDQHYLVPLLEDYLKHPNNGDIDKQLDDIRINIF